MVLNSTNAFEIYKKVEKSGDKIKSPYEVISVILNQLHKNIHLMILEIDKKKVPAFFVNDTVIVLEYSTNGQSQSLWSYAINLKSSKIVGSQVNAYNVLGAGLKARSLELTCKRNQ